MKHARKLLFLGVVLAALAGVTAPAYGGNGNSSNAQACQQNGWQSLTRTDLTLFSNAGACVSYAAQGGTLLPFGGVPNPGT